MTRTTARETITIRYVVRHERDAAPASDRRAGYTTNAMLLAVNCAR